MARTIQRQNFIRSTTSGIEFDDFLNLNQAEDIVNISFFESAVTSGTLIEDLNFIRTALRDLKGEGFRWFTPVGPDVTLSGLNDKINQVASTAIDRQGWIYFTDINGQGSGIVSEKIYQDSGNTVLQSGTADTSDLELDLKASYPLVRVVTVVGGTEQNVVSGTLPRSVDGSHYTGTVDYSVAGTAPFILKAQVITPGDDNEDCGIGACDTAIINLNTPPELLSLSFTGNYPGSQTELKAGDSFSITGTTDKPTNAIFVENFGAGTGQLLTFPEGTSFTVSMTIADRGTTTQALPARVRARNSAGGFGSTRDTDELGGTTDTVDLVNLNNVFPSFVDNGTTFPAGQLAFKGTEVGSQDTTVNNATSATYSSPHGDFNITNPTTLEAVKTITTTNPGDFNDSQTNFRIVALRAVNGSSSTFNKVIEVADIAPTLTITQPQTRLRSGSPAETYLITATADQNLVASPDVGIPVSGNWQGGAFSGGPKVWTRNLDIQDGDATGTAPWFLNTNIQNRAGLTSNSISGNENVGGFISRQLVVGAWPVREVAIGHNVVDTSKLICENLSKGGAGPNGGTIFTFFNTLTNTTNGFTITQPSGTLNNTGNIWYNLDLPNAVSNTTGTAIIVLEEVV